MNKHGRFPPGKLILLVLLMVAVQPVMDFPAPNHYLPKNPPPVPAIPKETEIPPILEVTQPIVFPTVTQQQPTATTEPPLPTSNPDGCHRHTNCGCTSRHATGIPNTGRSGSGVSELLKTAPARFNPVFDCRTNLPRFHQGMWLPGWHLAECRKDLKFRLPASPDQGAAVVVAAITVNGMPAIRNI